MFRNMVTSLIMHGRIKTTVAKAKELRSVAEKLVTLGKDGSLASRRRALANVSNPEAVKVLFNTFAEQYKERKGGYTRVLKLGARQGDQAEMALIEFVD